MTVFRYLFWMSQNPDVRWRQRLQSFRKALGQLSNGVKIAEERSLSDLETQGLIQAFEFTHELSWKVMKDFLSSHGTMNLYGSKDATREAFSQGLITHGEVWMEMITSRNQTSHTYNKDTADEISKAIIGQYAREFQWFLKRFTELEAQEE
mgnify:CR=1 FL=1